jgi:hypothetical protein
MTHDAVRAIHQDAVTVETNADGSFKAYDKDHKEITLDASAIASKASELAATNAILEKIIALETEITQRRQREAGSDDAGGSQSGRDWMKAQEAKIATERGKL